MTEPAVPTYATPTLAERRAEPAARVAYYANIVAQYESLFVDAGVPFEARPWHVIAMCLGCGVSTGNWCDACEWAGRTYVAHWGQRLCGAPLCSLLCCVLTLCALLGSTELSLSLGECAVELRCMMFCHCLLCCQLISNLRCLSDNCFGCENVNHIVGRL